jgi:VanZ family protein
MSEGAEASSVRDVLARAGAVIGVWWLMVMLVLRGHRRSC